MTQRYLVTEGATDVALLQKLLGPEFIREKNLTITDGGGWSGADSLARSLLALREEPVLVVVDADSADPRRVTDRRSFLEESLGQFASPEMYEVVLAIPELEVLYFADKVLLERLLGRPLSEEEFREGRGSPKSVLQKWLGTKDYATVLLERLGEDTWPVLRQSALAQEIVCALERLSSPLVLA